MHLNPKQPDDTAERYEGPWPIETFEQYFDVSRHFGNRMYGIESPRTHRSPFDRKQIRFLRPFEVIDFVGGEGPGAVFTNLERVIDRKLQLELIPYGSSNFDAAAFPSALVSDDFARVLKVIWSETSS